MKNLAKIPKKWGLYRPNRKLAVRLICQPDRLAVDRPSTANGHKYDRWGFRSTARSTGPCVCQTCTRLCTSVDRRVDRPMVRSAARSTDLACQPQSGSETRSEKHVKIFLKILLSFLKIPKNSFNILH